MGITHATVSAFVSSTTELDGTDWNAAHTTSADIMLAAPTGVAATDKAALQAALTATGTIRLPGGAYLINGTLKIYSNTRLLLSEDTIIKLTGGVGYTMLTNAALSKATASVTSITGSTSSLDATVVQTAHGKAVGDWVWLRGANQVGYIGVFNIITVTDANTYTIRLRRFPTASPATGTITATVPDQNIAVGGGKWNYDSATNTPVTTLNQLCMQLGGIQNFEMPGITRFGSSTKFNIGLGAVADYRIGTLMAEATNSDCLKIYGPAFNGTVDGTSGIVGDDLCSVQAREADIYSAYRFTYGPISGLKLQNQFCTKGATSVLVIYLDDVNDTDDVEIYRVEGTSTASSPIRIQPSDSITGATAGRIKLSNINCVSDGTAISLATSQTIRHLIIDSQQHLPSVAGGIGFKLVSGCTVQLLEVLGPRMNSAITDATAYMYDIEGTVNEARFVGGSQIGRGAGINLTATAVVKSLRVVDWVCSGADYPVRIQGAAAVDNLVVDGGSDTSPAANARCVVIEGSGVKSATVRNRVLGASMNSAIIVNSGVTNTPNISVENCTCDGLGTVNVSSSCRINVSGCRISSNSNGVIRTGGSPALLITATNNNVTAGRLITIPNGAPTISLNMAGGDPPAITTQVVVFGATPALDCSLGNNVTLSTSLTGNITWGAPTNVPQRGQSVTILMTQDGTGGRTVSWNAAYSFPVAWTNTGNTLGKVSMVVFVANEFGVLVAQNTNSWY